jgi:hypothetical protein
MGHLRWCKKTLAMAGWMALPALSEMSQPAGAQAAGWEALSDDTALSENCPAILGGNHSCSWIADSWGTGVMDLKRNRLLIWGGGHDDYWGNEVYALDFRVSPIVMRRLNEPNSNYYDEANCSAATFNAVTGDMEPVSRHPYDGLIYLPENPASSRKDKMFLFGGSKSKCGFGADDTWALDLETMRWEELHPAGDKPANHYGVVTAYDPNTDTVLMHDNNTLYRYCPEKNDSMCEANTWNKLADNGMDYHMTAAIDPEKKLLIIVGTGNVYVYSIAPGSDFDRHTVPTTGAEDLVSSIHPGVSYDTFRHRMTGWSGGDTVYALDIDTNTWRGRWSGFTHPGGPGEVTLRGINNRWEYVPALDAFALVNKGIQQSFLFRFGGVPPVALLPERARRLRIR